MINNIRHNIRVNLISKRSELNLSRKEFASMLSIETSAYATYESGKATPSIEVINKIVSKFFDGDFNLLLHPSAPEYWEGAMVKRYTH